MLLRQVFIEDGARRWRGAWRLALEKEVMNPLADIHRIIRFLEDKLDSVPDGNPRDFVRKMVDQFNQFRDKFYCSPKQVKYLRSLALQFGMIEQTSSGGRLQELKDKRHKILSRMWQHRHKQEDTDTYAMSGAAELRAQREQRVTARMRHCKSYERAFAMTNQRDEGDE